MYQPTHFVQTDAQAIAALLRAHPLATLVHHDPQGGLVADAIPMLWQPDASGGGGTLTGHVARANPLWQQADGTEVLAAFQGPQTYVSPGWYPSKAEHGKVVPTWNYAVVQAHGRLRAVQDAHWVRALLERLTAQHEANQARPWSVADAPADYIEAMLRAVVGIEITVTRLDAKWKVSQNRSEADRQGVMAGLAQQDGNEAAAMAVLVAQGTARG
ncbi:MAG: FMN-binding negative transcriptional regulator [Vitreoscilla sp.]|nr:FMN-binding negative transcriptional regulator [Burkholderiales bacterium]MBP6336610.1 FMN-binding negative transcriptional regulator [Vitreoscilla sp.]MBP6676323.1 FMN-binding negative transcriptional regulator [Vitreoscilla sp.]